MVHVQNFLTKRQSLKWMHTFSPKWNLAGIQSDYDHWHAFFYIILVQTVYIAYWISDERYNFNFITYYKTLQWLPYVTWYVQRWKCSHPQLLLYFPYGIIPTGFILVNISSSFYKLNLGWNSSITMLSRKHLTLGYLQRLASFLDIGIKHRVNHYDKPSRE